VPAMAGARVVAFSSRRGPCGVKRRGETPEKKSGARTQGDVTIIGERLLGDGPPSASVKVIHLSLDGGF